MSFLRNIFWPTVNSRRDLRRYIVSVTLLILLAEILSDVVAGWIPLPGFDDTAKQFICDALVSIAVAWPIASAIGNVQLQLFEAKQEADRLGRTDPLTGLANRRAFYEAATKLEGGAIALVIADIDRFKRINDRYGHAVGDEVLAAVAHLMQRELEDLGTIARVGGEEFAVVCGDRPPSEIRERLSRFCRRVAEQPFAVGGSLVFATISAGIAAQRGAKFDELYAAADKALYFAKSNGRNRVVDFDEIDGILDGPATNSRQAS